MTREVLDALPAAHNIQAAAVMIPGVTVSGLVGNNGRDVGGTTKLQQPSLSFRGTILSITAVGRLPSRQPDRLRRRRRHQLLRQRRQRAGARLLVRRRFGRDGASRVCTSTSCRRTAGNRFSGYLFGDFTLRAMVGEQSDADAARRAASPTSPRSISISDFNPGIGGPTPQGQAVVLRRVSLRGRSTRLWSTATTTRTRRRTSMRRI